MKSYLFSRKSHCSAPDLEFEVSAESKDQAIEMIYKHFGEEIDKNTIRQSTGTFANIMSKWMKGVNGDDLHSVWKRNKK